MFDPRFSNFQNTVQDQGTAINPYQDQYFGQNDKTPYREAMSIPMPQPMPGNVTENNLYPLESSLASPALNIPVNGNGASSGYAEGGQVRKPKKKEKFNPYPTLAEMIRQQGGKEDVILAHINPLEAQILGLIAKGGKINPVTGLPQFGTSRTQQTPVQGNDWTDQLSNLGTVAAVIGSFFKDKPKEKSPEQLGQEYRRLKNAKRKSPADIQADASAKFLKKQAEYRNRYNLAGGESLAAAPIYRKVNTPEEYQKNNRWLEYYDKPDFSGNPILMAMGGKVPEMQFEEEEIEYPSGGLGFYLKGHTGGQDDKIPAKLSDGEYVIPADVVSHAGDGNNKAGAMKFDALLKNIRKAKGGSAHLPPKAKSLASYMMR